MKIDYFETFHDPETVKGPFGLFENPVCCKISKKLKGDPLETLKRFRTKNLTKPKLQAKNIGQVRDSNLRPSVC